MDQVRPTKVTLIAGDIFLRLIWWPMQAPSSVIRSKQVPGSDSKKTKGTGSVGKMIERCSLALAGRLQDRRFLYATAFMSQNNLSLLGLIEGKLLDGDFQKQAAPSAIKQTLCFPVLSLFHADNLGHIALIHRRVGAVQVPLLVRPISQLQVFRKVMVWMNSIVLLRDDVLQLLLALGHG